MRNFLILFSLVVTFLLGCKKEENTNTPTSSPPPTAGVNEISYLNGVCGYNNNVFQLNPNSARFVVNQNYTAIQQLRNNVATIALNFPGASVGSYLLTNSAGSTMIIQLNDSISTCAPATGAISDSIVVNVTNYQSVGGLIEGTWAGRLELMIDPLQKINASGKFSLIRGADQ